MSPLFSFLLSMIPGTVALGGGDVLLKKLLSRGIPEQLLLGFSLGGAGVVLALLTLLFGVPEIKPGFITAIAATTVLNSFGQFAWYRAFRHGSVSLVAPLRLLIPLLVIGTAFLFLRERPTLFGVVGILVTIAGLQLLFQAEAAALKETVRGIVRSPAVQWGLLGVLAFAFSFPFDKQAVVTSSALFSASIIFPVVGAVNAFFFFLTSGHTARESLSRIGENGKLLLAQILFMTVGILLTFHALNFALAAYASSVKRLQAFWSVLFSGAFLKEGNIRQKLLATLLMLFGIAVTVLFG